jgi:hypothetical protein
MFRVANNEELKQENTEMVAMVRQDVWANGAGSTRPPAPSA